MAESYCGKSCSDCTQKSQAKCPGCRVGPGKKYGGSCNISKCCVSKNHQSCEQCVNASTCSTLRNKNGAQATRERQEEKDTAAMKRRFESSSVLGRWLMLMFWLCIGSNAADLVFMFMGLQNDITLIKNVCSILFFVLDIVALFMLASASYRFRMSAIFTAVNCAVTFAGALIEHEFFAVVLSLGSLVLLLLAEYNEFMGLIEVTEEANDELSEKWSKLWTSYFICLCASLVGAVLTAFGIGLAALITLLAVVGALVAAVFKIIYLYRTGVFFRNMSSELQYWHLMS